MITTGASDELTDVLRYTIVELVRQDGPDLSARQLGVFLTCYLETEAQTVRGLAAKLNGGFSPQPYSAPALLIAATWLPPAAMADHSAVPT